MLLAECAIAEVDVRCGCRVESVEKRESFSLGTNQGVLECDSLVIATGGFPSPSSARSDFGYRLAQQFGLALTATRPGLVPLTLGDEERAVFCAAQRRVVAGDGAGRRRLVCRVDALHPSRPERSGDPANFVLLARRRKPTLDLLPQRHAADSFSGIAGRKRIAQDSARTRLAGAVRGCLVRSLCAAKAAPTNPREDLEQLARLVHHWPFAPTAPKAIRKRK